MALQESRGRGFVPFCWHARPGGSQHPSFNVVSRCDTCGNSLSWEQSVPYTFNKIFLSWRSQIPQRTVQHPSKTS